MKNKIPTNLKEAINELDKIISEEDKEYILEHGALSVHHSLGRWIRNNWVLWENDSILKFNMIKLGFIHPDDISNHIIEEFINKELDDFINNGHLGILTKDISELQFFYNSLTEEKMRRNLKLKELQKTL